MLSFHTTNPIEQASRQSPRAPRTRLSRTRGLSLVEVLVSLFLLSIMTLGYFSLQEISLVTSIRNDHRTQATRLVNELVEVYAVYNGAGAGTGLLSNFVFDHSATPFAGACPFANLNAQVGDTATVLNNFLLCWQARVRDTLPGGQAVNAIPASGLGLNITITWGLQSQNETVFGYVF